MIENEQANKILQELKRRLSFKNIARAKVRTKINTFIHIVTKIKQQYLNETKHIYAKNLSKKYYLDIKPREPNTNGQR